MTINTDEIMAMLNNLAKEERLKVTIKKSIKCGLIIGGASTVGGLLLGPLGLAIGGVIASCATAISQQNEFESVVTILLTMEPERKEALADNVRRIIHSLDVNDVGVLIGLMSSNTSVRRQVINELIHFVGNEVQRAAVSH